MQRNRNNIKTMCFLHSNGINRKLIGMVKFGRIGPRKLIKVSRADVSPKILDRALDAVINVAKVDGKKMLKKLSLPPLHHKSVGEKT